MIALAREDVVGRQRRRELSTWSTCNAACESGTTRPEAASVLLLPTDSSGPTRSIRRRRRSLNSRFLRPCVETHQNGCVERPAGNGFAGSKQAHLFVWRERAPNILSHGQHLHIVGN